MRILMVSPHPTYSPRGTPISVLNRCRALSALGHDVDLVTYGIGQNVPVPGLTYVRAPVPGIKAIKIGPSPAKLLLDAAVFAKACVRLLRHRGSYDVLHTHEEAGILGPSIARLARLPHVYDMGNDLQVVMRNYGFAERHPATRVAGALEGSMVRSATVVIAHFPTVAERARTLRAEGASTVLVPNIALEGEPDQDLAAAFRREWASDDMAVVLYTGTLESYQGLEAAVDGFSQLARLDVRARLIVVGGTPEQQRALHDRAAAAGDRVRVIGTLPARQIPSALAAADALLSPRRSGSNTPLKLFSYLRSGRPVIATRIESHTQILDDDCAVLVAATPDGIARGVAGLVADPGNGRRLAAVARQRVAERYTSRDFVRRIADAYAQVGAGTVNDTDVDSATERMTAHLVGAP